MSRQRVLVAWSSGKDSAWLLSLLRRDPSIDVVGLLTTFNEASGGVAMHEVPQDLVAAQARAAALPLWPVWLPWPCPNEVYAARMANAIAHARAEEVDAIAFGDLHLADIRRYREQQLEASGITALFPLWCTADATPALARTMIDGGIAATLACIDTSQLDRAFLGRSYDAALLAEFPATVDPCGEHGEFHTFCTHAPCFDQPIAVRPAAERDGDGFVWLSLEAA